MEIKERIKTLRKERKLTQEEFAKMLDVSVMTIRRYESGKQEPKPTTMKKMAEILSVTVESLISKSVENSVSTDLTDTEVSLINTFRSLNESGQNKVVEYAQDLNDNPKFKKNNK